jgi:hypothetical protein
MAKKMRKPKKKNMRIFNTGATRDNDEQKLNYTGSLSPLVLKRFVKFMRDHNIKGGELQRDESNWKKGIPQQSYMDSKIRHIIDTWLLHEGYLTEAEIDDIEETLCAEIFNSMGMLREILVKKIRDKSKESTSVSYILDKNL